MDCAWIAACDGGDQWLTHEVEVAKVEEWLDHTNVLTARLYAALTRRRIGSLLGRPSSILKPSLQ
jgi:hypothetical protein